MLSICLLPPSTAANDLSLLALLLFVPLIAAMACVCKLLGETSVTGASVRGMVGLALIARVACTGSGGGGGGRGNEVSGTTGTEEVADLDGDEDGAADNEAVGDEDEDDEEGVEEDDRADPAPPPSTAATDALSTTAAAPRPGGEKALPLDDEPITVVSPDGELLTGDPSPAV